MGGSPRRHDRCKERDDEGANDVTAMMAQGATYVRPGNEEAIVDEEVWA